MKNHLSARLACSLFAAASFVLVAFGSDQFRITHIQVSSNDVRITWNAPAGSNYVVQASPTLDSGQGTFMDVSSVVPNPGPGARELSVLIPGGAKDANARFYRVRSIADNRPRGLVIYPTNVVMAVGMTNRYQVFAVLANGNLSNVTADAEMVSEPAALATILPQAGEFKLVKARRRGTGTIRASYMGVTNRVNLTVARLLGVRVEPPLSQVSGLASFDASNVRDATRVQVIATFDIGGSQVATNVTLASALGGEGSIFTRIEYTVQPDVANAFALISGQSAANSSSPQDGIRFELVDEEEPPLVYTTPGIGILWCDYVSVTPEAPKLRIRVGEKVTFAIKGLRSDRNSVPVNNPTLESSDSFVARADNDALTVEGIFPGTVRIIGAELVRRYLCSHEGEVFLTVTDEPAITREPGDQTIPISSNATFTVVATAMAPLSYQWEFNGMPLAGATLSSLTISNVGSAQEGDYRVVVSNNSGSVVSRFARLTVTSSSVPFWTNLYRAPANIAAARAVTVDRNGNAIITGAGRGSPGGADFTTVFYSGAGTPLWANRYNGPGNSEDFAQDVETDFMGNVFVTGFSPGSATASDFATIKYNNAGVALWTNRYNGPASGADTAQALVVDPNAAVLVTGSSRGTNGMQDILTIKYSNAGFPLWTNRFHGPGNGDDVAQAIAVDAFANVFVLGSSRRTSTDFVIIKYSAGGFPLWTNFYNGPADGNDVARSLVVDSLGNALVTGASPGLGTLNDYATIKYSAAGELLWQQRYNGPNGGEDIPRVVAVDPGGSVFVTGTSSSLPAEDILTIKYSAAGVPLWTRRYNGSGNGPDIPQAMVADQRGDIFLTGETFGGSNADIVTLKYSGDGGLIWIAHYNGSGNQNDRAYAAALDERGDLFIAGESSSGVSTDSVIIKYCGGPSPANDNFNNATLLSTLPLTTSAKTDCASKEPGEPAHAGNPGGRSVWWVWTAASSGLVRVSTCGSDFDTLLSIYTGSSIGTLTLVESNDDSLNCGTESRQSELQFHAQAGTTYRIAVDGYKFSALPHASSGNVMLNVQH